MAQQPTPVSTNPAQSQSLYRKYRPTSFDPEQLVGQEHVARTLRNAIVLDRVAHAYLFCGPRGTGKTSTARLLAKAVNCQAPDPHDRPCNQCEACLAIMRGSVVDIIEIDAASNRGVDDIRDLREKVRYAPTQLAVKFYIIDEAHQLTRDAFNAFLKTLEEPPGHVKFVLATTEAEKLPDTVASRCQRFDFRRIPVESALSHLRNVCQWEAIEAEEEALLLIARHATGSLRDALGLLDQLALYGEQDGEYRTLTAATVRQVLGLSDNERIVGLVRAIADEDPGAALRLITEASDQGEDVHQLNRQMIGYLRLLMHLRAGGTPPEADDVASQLAQEFSLERLSQLMRTFMEVDAASNRSTYSQLPIELAIVRSIVQHQQLPATDSHVEPPETTSPAASKPKTQATSTRAAERRDALPPAPSRTDAEQPAASSSESSPEPRPTTRRTAAASGPGDDLLEHLAANWTHIRRDVKAENSRIAALLSSADPAAVTENQIVLVASYEFHRNKINEDSSRLVIERVLQQYTHSTHQLICVAPEDVSAVTARPENANGVGGVPASEIGDPEGSEDAGASSIAASGTTTEPAKPEANSAGTDSDSNLPSETSAADAHESQADSSSVNSDAGNSAAPESGEPETRIEAPATDEELARLEAARRIFEARENS